jgi:biotin/methionine sulfoxide reductase
VLLDEGLHDQQFLDTCCEGGDRFAAYVLGEEDGRPKDPSWAAAITGIDAAELQALARDMAAHRTLISATWSLQRADHGEQPYWMTVALACLLGQVGLPGGGFGFGYGSVGGEGTPKIPFPVPRLRSPANPVGGAIPVSRVVDMLERPGAEYDHDGERRTYPDIRLMYWAGGNPFHHHQDLNRMLAAWQRPDTVIVHDPWWTANARHADIVLPATTTLERDDIGAASKDRHILAMRRAIEPVDEARDDFAIFSDLARRLGSERAFTEGRTTDEWLRHLYADAVRDAAAHGVALPDFDAFWSAGQATLPTVEPRVLLGELRAGERLGTPSGRIELWSATIESYGYDDCPPHPAWLEPQEWLGSPLTAEYPIHLLSAQPRTRLHGQLDMGRVSLAAKVAGREPCEINRHDAARRGIADGSVVRVFNERGACLAGAVLCDDLMEGVAVLATGAWYDPLEPGRAGTLDKHGNPNVLTADRGTSRLAQGPSAQSALVEIEPWTGDVPTITAFDPPV